MLLRGAFVQSVTLWVIPRGGVGALGKYPSRRPSRVWRWRATYSQAVAHRAGLRWGWVWLQEKGSDATFLREMIGFALPQHGLMELESESLCRAGHG
jgi:hypothetical protein